MSETVQAKIPLSQNKRFLSGIMFLVTGAVAIFIAQDYPMGSALRMGPGYFPIVLGGLIGLFGIWELIIGVLKPDPVKGYWPVAYLWIFPAVFIVIALIIKYVGSLVALPLLVVLIIGCRWLKTGRPITVLPLAAVLFGLLMEHAGFVPALVALIYASAWAGDEFKIVEVTLWAIGLTIACVGIFIYGLGLPYPLFSGH
jgi:hypothetical protein